MKLCSDGHAEICYDEGTRSCPACAALYDLAEAEEKLAQSEKDVASLETQLEEVSAELSDLQAEVREERKNDPSLS